MFILLFLIFGMFSATLLWSICVQAKRADEISYKLQMEKSNSYEYNSGA